MLLDFLSPSLFAVMSVDQQMASSFLESTCSKAGESALRFSFFGVSTISATSDNENQDVQMHESPIFEVNSCICQIGVRDGYLRSAGLFI